MQGMQYLPPFAAGLIPYKMLAIGGPQQATAAVAPRLAGFAWQDRRDPGITAASPGFLFHCPS